MTTAIEKSGHGDREHARLSPSAAKRWMACPGSVQACDGLPDEPSEAAKEGTRAHEWAEHVIKTELVPGYLEQLDPAKPVPVPDDENMEERTAIYTDYCLDLAGTCCIVKTESRLSLEHLHKDIWGTGDFIGLDVVNKILHSVDLKYGYTVVEAADNPQLRIYGLAAVGEMWEEIKKAGIKMDELTVRCTIVQPRAEHPDGPIRYEGIKLSSLIWWANSRLLPAAKLTEKPDAQLHAGPHCEGTWCPAIRVCPEYRARTEALVSVGFDGFHGGAFDLNRYSPEQLGKMMEFWIGTSSIKDKTFEFAQALMLQGHQIPGFKLVKKKAHRKYRNEAQAEGALVSVLGHKAYNKKLVSPAQAEKALKAAGLNVGIVSQLAEVPDGGLTIAPETDSRPAVLPEASIDALFNA